jgi:serine-type D-Ala-D-Ala carboxypeptidase (penicillin-binding protein 5/6)
VPTSAPRRCIATFLSVCVFAAACFVATPATAVVVAPGVGTPQPPPPAVTVPAATLQTMDGQVLLWSRDPDRQRRVASTIKLLNALVVRKNARLDDVVVVPAKAAAIWDGEVGLVTGQRLTVDQLLQMMLVASANDAAETLAIHIGGSEANYVRMMNAEAKRLKLTRTRAADPHGLGKREVSTANDLVVLTREVMKDPVLKRMLLQRSVSVPQPGRRPRVVKSTDLLLGAYPGIQGVKTGFTNPAGYCFVSSAKRGSVEIVGVVLGAKSNKARFAETRKLLDWGFAHYRERVVVSKDDTAGVAPISGGVETTVSVHPEQSLAVLEFDGDPVERVFRIATSTPAPVAAGQAVGQVLLVRRRSVVATVALVADKPVAVAPAPVEPSPIVGLSRALQRFVDFWGRLTGFARRSASVPARRPSPSPRVAAATTTRPLMR